MSEGRIVHRPRDHKCYPPNGGASTFFDVNMTTDDVGTIWECECGDWWIVRPYRHRPQHNRRYERMSRREQRHAQKRLAVPEDKETPE